MRDEREILLAVATEEEWQNWLQRVIDGRGETDDPGDCLFCLAYGRNKGELLFDEGAHDNSCGRCMPEEYRGGPGPCMDLKNLDEKIERAKERLRQAGIWED